MLTRLDFAGADDAFDLDPALAAGALPVAAALREADDFFFCGAEVAADFPLVAAPPPEAGRDLEEGFFAATGSDARAAVFFFRLGVFAALPGDALRPLAAAFFAAGLAAFAAVPREVRVLPDAELRAAAAALEAVFFFFFCAADELALLPAVGEAEASDRDAVVFFFTGDFAPVRAEVFFFGAGDEAALAFAAVFFFRCTPERVSDDLDEEVFLVATGPEPPGMQRSTARRAGTVQNTGPGRSGQ